MNALFSFITTPFGYLLGWLYQLTGNYGAALILFAILLQAILLPMSAMAKKSSMKMSRLQPRMQEIQRKYADDKQKQQEAMRELQQKEGVGMGCGGCLWSLLPLLILIPVFTMIREPMTHILHIDNAADVVATLKASAPEGVFGTKGAHYDQLAALSYMKNYASYIMADPQIDRTVLTAEILEAGKTFNFSFLGIDLSAIPQIFNWSGGVTWNKIGQCLLPLLSAGQQVVQMKISQKMNNSVITDDNGMYDEETAKKSQANQTSKAMIWMMPALSLWIGFTVPVALSLYWFIGGVVRMGEDILLTRHYRKKYDEEDAERMKKFMAEEAALEEKERIRAEKRAANPEGITENTSKKKLQKKQQQEEEAAKAAAKKEYDAKRGIVTEEPKKQQDALSGIQARPYCKGRAYDPNRYNSEATEDK